MDATQASTIIDSALLGASQGVPLSESLPPGENPVVPGPLPTDEPVTDADKETPEQKKAREEQEKIEEAQDELLGKEEAEALREEERQREEREKTLIGLADKALQASKGAASSAGTRIGNLPTPGNLGFPLTLLILFFFILITYAGRSRLQWIGLVLTNNAYVTTSVQGNGTGGGAPVPAQETLVGAIAPAISSSGMYGSPF